LREMGVPLAFGGFSFSDLERNGDTERTWENWSQGQLFVPERLYYSRDRSPLSEKGGSGLFLHFIIEPDDTEGSVLRRIECAFSSLSMGKALPQKGDSSSSFPETVHLESKKAFCGRVEAVKEAISQQNSTGVALKKVVLARADHLTAPRGSGFDPMGTVCALRRQHPTAFSFAISNGKGDVFLGATPETLVRVSGGVVSTQALAGTAPRGLNQGEDERYGDALLSSQKERGEHQLVVDAIVEGLAPLCSRTDVPEVPQLTKLNHVQHLMTPISGYLNRPVHLLDMVDRLHPTPALGGWPRGEAITWIEDKEPLERGWYGGPVGWLDQWGEGVFAVAIRSALIRGESAWVYAGAGIVEASNPDNEWRETCLKLDTAMSGLQFMEASE
jgi:salicylate biosynthesis isochorismate synthase